MSEGLAREQMQGPPGVTQLASEEMSSPALEIRNLTKVYSRRVKAVDGVSLSIKRGEIFGLLGPNGAGKSTLVKTALTLTRQDSGQVFVSGIDTSKHRAKARRLMGYVPQEVSVDGELTGFENLLIFSKLFRVGRVDRKERIEHALTTMGLRERADDLVNTYSGGMMRRLEIAEAIVNRPRMLFLDEPSIGLDPSAKHEVWRLIGALRKDLDSTIMITTHDMDEAERLCDRVAIINQGKLVAMGTPGELKAFVGGDVVSVRLKGGISTPLSEIRFPSEIGATILSESTNKEGEHASHEVSVVVRLPAEEAALKVTKSFEQVGYEITSLSYNRPNLDDVFLKFTQTRIDEVDNFRQAESNRRSFIGHGS